MGKIFNTLSLLGLLSVLILAGCTAGGNDPGTEYAPQMYHSVPYEPLTQITDKDRGTWLDSNEGDGHGEFYNSNPYNEYENKYNINVLTPVEGTVRRGEELPYRIPYDSVAQASEMLENPYAGNEDIIPEGKALYDQYCEHCHGEKGLGNGLVAEVYKGVPAYNAGATKDLSAGHIFHVITHGIRRMGAHGSQISQDDRWKIVTYVQTLQQQ
jgi:mono/diheme cytochrome c family protein